MTDKKDKDVTTPDLEEVKTTLENLFGDSADIEVVSVAEMKKKELSKFDMITEALKTVDHESTNKLIDELIAVLHSTEEVSIIEFGVVLSVLCEVIAEGTEDVPAVGIAELALALTHASHVMKQKEEEAEDQSTLH